MTEEIRTLFESRSSGHLCLLDLKKAFDTVDNQIFLKIIEFLGRRGKINNLIKSYLSGRKQFALWDNSKLVQKSITYGVPQGSTSGPLLFILYVNDLPSAPTDCKIVLHFDDTSLFCCGKKSGVVLEKNVEEVTKWLFLKVLIMNADKCEIICFRASNDTPNNPNSFKENDSWKYLGTHLDKNLNVRHHISRVIWHLSEFYGINYKLHNFSITQTSYRFL